MSTGFVLPLFVPGDRPERFDKAIASGAGAVILDLEDAVAPDNKNKARQAVGAYLSAMHRQQGKTQVFIRINAKGTQWFAHDVEMLSAVNIGNVASDLSGTSGFDSTATVNSSEKLAGIVLPKTEQVVDILALKKQFGPEWSVWALIETAAGFANARQLATHADRLVFGSIDFCSDMGLAHEDAVLTPYRAELVLAARLADKYAPIDGVTVNLDQAEVVQKDAMRACAEGFAGKLLIHPKQVQAARAGFQPSQEDVDHATLLLASSETQGAHVINGQMIDKPVLDRARATLARWEATQ